MSKTSFLWQLAKGTWAVQFSPQQAGSSLRLTLTDGCFFSPNLSFQLEFLNYSGLSIIPITKGAGFLDTVLCVTNFKTTAG